jgi:hypothetical protein
LLHDPFRAHLEWRTDVDPEQGNGVLQELRDTPAKEQRSAPSGTDFQEDWPQHGQADFGPILQTGK